MIPHIIASTQHLVDYEGGTWKNSQLELLSQQLYEYQLPCLSMYFFGKSHCQVFLLAIRDWEQRKHKKLIGRLHVCNCKDSKLFII